jgi:D-lactate dehydrogenase (cytochrome)
VESVLKQLQAVNTIEAVLTDEHSRVLYSQDVWQRGETCAAVVRPATVEQLAQSTKVITSAGFALIARGGGMSYTRGYTPVERNTFIIDCQGLNRIVEINRSDMYVTVEAGCSWKSLYEALKGSGLRTPYWGPLSGAKATVGGSISQNR